MQKRVLRSPPVQAGKIKEGNAHRGRTEEQRPGLYLHIPFCTAKCRYCNFFSVTKVAEIPRFLKALFKEALLQGGGIGSFDTLYIGGGTPSLLAPFQLSELFSHLRKTYDICEDAEVTMEVNPADVGLPVLAQMRALGINRLNIGVQSFDDTLLAFLGRRHDGNQAIQSIMAARQAGFDHVGIDLIYGIPGQTRQAGRRLWSMRHP
jgi:oxygen-independent coproporphyrinogen-3 oxidase